MLILLCSLRNNRNSCDYSTVGHHSFPIGTFAARAQNAERDLAIFPCRQKIQVKVNAILKFHHC